MSLLDRLRRSHPPEPPADELSRAARDQLVAAAAMEAHLDKITKSQAAAAVELELIREQVELIRRAAKRSTG